MLWLRRIILAFASFIAILLTLWAVGALLFRLAVPAFRAPTAIVYLIVVLGAILFLRRGHKGLLVAFAGLVFVALWWFILKPPDSRNWQPDSAETAYADITGDQVTVLNVRNFGRVWDKSAIIWQGRSSRQKSGDSKCER